jgi:hypothetical protein
MGRTHTMFAKRSKFTRIVSKLRLHFLPVRLINQRVDSTTDIRENRDKELEMSMLEPSPVTSGSRNGLPLNTFC